MSKFVKLSVLLMIILVTVITAAGCSKRIEPGKDGEVTPASSSTISMVNATTSDPVQSNGEGNVTIDVEWIEIENLAEKGSLTFYVTMNTHSVNLDNYDLRELATLRDDSDNEYQPVSWESASGGHHRKGTLVFSLPDSLRQGSAEYVEVVIRSVAGIDERILKWEL